MNFTQLEYALSLQRLGSFTQAAKAHGLTQPGLSLQIKNLEQEIGMVLFDRSRSRVTPTSDGVQFLLKASDIVMAGKQLKEFASKLGQMPSGTLKIGIIPTLAPYLVPLFISEFIQKYPDIQLEISELLTEAILQRLRLGDLDGGIVSTPVTRKGLNTRTLFYERFFLYQSESQHLSSGEAMSVSNLEQSDLWLLEEGNCFRDQVTDICAFKEDKVQPGMFRYKCSSIDSLLRMVDHYGGSTILPELTTLSLSGHQEERIVDLDEGVREISFVSKRFTGKDAIFDLLEECILENIPKQMKSNEGREIVDPGIMPSWG